MKTAAQNEENFEAAVITCITINVIISIHRFS